VDRHLALKAHEVDQETGLGLTPRWLENVTRHLDRAVEFWGKERMVAGITANDVLAWIAKLRETIGGSSARHHINSLSNLFRRAMRDELIVANPVTLLDRKEKPAAGRREADWLEVGEAARLLAAAERYQPTRDDIGMPFAYPLIATLLLTGGRPSEVLGLEIDDVSLTHGTITFRPHAHRRLKNAGAHRTVKLWPQLEGILKAYFQDYEQRYAESRLLFPSFRTGQEAPLTDFRKLLRKVVKLADPAIRTRLGRRITPKIFRHTYCSARAQTAEPGTRFFVRDSIIARELGHGGEAMVRRVYRHLNLERIKPKPVLEYRVAQPKQQERGVQEFTFVRRRRSA
jgi:integrase